ncbi:ketoacyl-ACP synthase III family protein [Streptomyces spectabilis]|uniref:3-oxoacyl-ACP synthase n=1 Tax=Streptomyces spectabilis TaxID=68270 RepID=A0A5P2X4P6_STRST|nr:ketoacyl-ACP synthase III family protein [Streptomyces spectabilis]MBB5101376.1 3-oxoacyl-[acyl-carrier-protein] synthase-3 [Streptomyces spectabilis]MCI3900572.1 ketoacyl-ACP synthase III family protein [Streptomyces spectabilis]QEV58135.1 3-oxoacyl-ACP synthase [Streptomyces spectabilis]GGV10994.1 3-oxoacyl-ACP synthase [Streptomyces spectabilis]
MPPATAIRAAACYQPDRVLAVADLPGLAELGDGERETCARLGIDEVRADESLTAFDLAVRAARQALSDADLTAAELGALVLIDARVPDTLMSSAATRLQALLGAERALTFSVGGLGCVSLTPALLTARGLLAADGDLDHVLVVHGSKPPTPLRYRHPVTVSGDGGAAAVISRRGPVRVLDIVQETNGDHWDLFRVDYRDRPSARWREECRDIPQYSFRLAVESRIRLRELHRRLLDRNGLAPGDISRHLSHNLSEGTFRFTEEALGIEISTTCFDNLRRYGHLGPNDVLLNLRTELDRGGLAEGQRAVLLSASPVAAWSLLLVEIGDGATTHYL